MKIGETKAMKEREEEEEKEKEKEKEGGRGIRWNRSM